MKKTIAIIGLIAVIAAGFWGYHKAKQSPLLSMALGINNNQASAEAFARLLDTLVDMEDTLNDRPAASAESYRALLHALEGGLVSTFEQDPNHPEFKRSVTTTRKILGDHPDAIYHETAINPQLRYAISGNMAGAVYLSLTVHDGIGDNNYAGEISAVLNSDELSIEEDGSFRFVIGPEPAADGQTNYLQLSPQATDIIIRHYFEEPVSVATDLNRHIPMLIEPLDLVDPQPAPTDESIAASIDRVSGYVRTRLELFTKARPRVMPAFVSKTPNQFVKPVKPGSLALSNADAAYSQAPYVLQGDEALVITGTMPKARMANVVLWNAYLQSYNYRHRQISLNRDQIQYEDDGSFKIIIAHQKPEHPNWLDTEGRNFGLVYWRFLLPEEDIEPLNAQVVKFADL